MGVFKKLKDVLFDVEEEEIIVNPQEEKAEASRSQNNNEIRRKFEKSAKPPKEENTITEIKIPREEVPERELIKAESTFNFPLEVDESRASRASRSFDLDRERVKPKPKLAMDFSRSMAEEPKRDTNKPFKPTPIISPVYGILDQNYSKDDVIIKTDMGVKGPDLDAVRKKAYGLEPKKETKKPLLEEDPLKTLDEILMEEEQAQISKTIPEIKIEDPTEIKTELEVTKVAVDPASEPVPNPEDTLETDLFNLIDSMYEDKEEREEE